MRRTSSDRLLVLLPTPAVAIIPALFAFTAVVLTSFPVSLTGGLFPPPLFVLMVIYYWALIRPDLMPPGLVFAIGLLEDLLSGSPPGLWTSSFLVTYVLIDRQRDVFAGLAGWAAILGFALAMLIASVSAYGIAWLYFWHVPPIQPLALQFAASIVLYVPVLSFLNWVQQRFIGPQRSDF